MVYVLDQYQFSQAVSRSPVGFVGVHEAVHFVVDNAFYCAHGLYQDIFYQITIYVLDDVYVATRHRLFKSSFHQGFCFNLLFE